MVWKEGSAWEVFWIQEQKVRQLKGGTRPSAERRARSWTEAPGIGKAMEVEKEKEEDTDSETDDGGFQRGAPDRRSHQLREQPGPPSTLPQAQT